MRSIPRLFGAGALFLASSLAALTLPAEAGMRMSYRPYGPSYAHSAYGFGGYRGYGSGFGYRDHFFRRQVIGGIYAGAAYGAAAAYPNYGPAQYDAQPVGVAEQPAYAAEPSIYAPAPQTYTRTYVVPTVVYHTVTQNYTIPVRTYRTESQVRYVPVTSYRAVTTEVQVPVTAYQTYQRTVQVPVTVYRQVHKTCSCSYSQ
jgi:hypothetical protein